MKHLHVLILAIVFSSLLFGISTQPGKHLFILSGQSNMVRFSHYISFVPAVSEKFGSDNIIVVKDALGGQPIRRWYKQWKPAQGDGPKVTGDLYDRLMGKVKTAVGDRKPDTVTFVWMQGERDAREKHGDVYAASLKGLIDQLKAGLGREDVNFVIGRLSDFDNGNKRYPHWTMVREVQMKLADDNPRWRWIDTDDLNTGPSKPNWRNGKVKQYVDDLHMSAEGYKIMGGRFAEQAIELIER